MYKLVLAGDAAVGKSSFILRLCKNRFFPSLNSTLGMYILDVLSSKSLHWCEHMSVKFHDEGVSKKLFDVCLNTRK